MIIVNIIEKIMISIRNHNNAKIICIRILPFFTFVSFSEFYGYISIFADIKAFLYNLLMQFILRPCYFCEFL